MAEAAATVVVAATVASEEATKIREKRPRCRGRFFLRLLTQGDD